MASTIPDGFDRFLGKLTPSDAESEAAKRHRSSIEDCLRREFGLEAFFQSGSFGHGTSIRDHSDVDRFAVLPVSALGGNNNSLALLRRVGRALQIRFPTTGVGLHVPAIRCPFGGKRVDEITEVIPAFQAAQSGARVAGVYLISDGRGGWINSAPIRHNEFVDAIDEQHHGRVKPLVRFVKAWKYLNSLPVKSFYLEMRTALYACGTASTVYPTDLHRIFFAMQQDKLADLHDPIGASGAIQATDNQAARRRTLLALAAAVRDADQAVLQEMLGRVQPAFNFWRRVFHGQFPAYWL